MYDPLYSILEEIIGKSTLSLKPLLQLLDISLKQTERAIFKVTNYPDVQVIADIITKIGEVNSAAEKPAAKPAAKPAPTPTPPIDFDKLPVLGNNKYRIYPYKKPINVADYRELFGLRVGTTTTLDTITTFFDDKSIYLVSEFVKTTAEKKPAPPAPIPLKDVAAAAAKATEERAKKREVEIKEGPKPAAAPAAAPAAEPVEPVEPVAAKESSEYQKYELKTISLTNSTGFTAASGSLEMSKAYRLKKKPYITPFILALSILILFKKQLNSNGAGGEAAEKSPAP
jgi:hypothetical protein